MYKILYTFGYSIGLGGHFNSALSMIRELSNRGHGIHVVGAQGSESEKKREFENAGAVCHEIKGFNNWNLALPPVKGCSELMDIIESEHIQIIHSQDYQSLSRAYAAAVKKKTALVSTFPGGSFFHHVPAREAETVVFSQEQVDAMRNRYGLDPEKLHLVPARIDLEKYAEIESKRPLFSENSMDDESKTVFMATRFHPAKEMWFQGMIQSAELLNRNPEMSVKFIIAGDGELFESVKKQVDELNNCKGKILVDLVGPVYDSRKLNGFYNAADIVAGSGRGIMEAMAVGKPVIVMNRSGEGELVTPETVDAVAYYNFSGRNLTGTQAGQPLWDLLKKIFQNDTGLSPSGDFSRQYVLRNLDSKLGTDRLLEIYQKALTNKITKTGFIKWYTRAVFNGMSRVPGAICRRWCSARKND